MSSLNPTPEEAKAHKFLKAGKRTGKTPEEAASTQEGRDHPAWWMQTQPHGTETWRMITTFLENNPPPAPAQPATPATATSEAPKS